MVLLWMHEFKNIWCILISCNYFISLSLNCLDGQSRAASSFCVRRLDTILSVSDNILISDMKTHLKHSWKQPCLQRVLIYLRRNVYRSTNLIARHAHCYWIADRTGKYVDTLKFKNAVFFFYFITFTSKSLVLHTKKNLSS